MTPADVADVLRYVSSLDQWMATPSPEQAATMIAGWSTLLDAVPAEVGMAAVRAHYSQPDARSIQPGDVLDYATSRRKADALRAARERDHEPVHATPIGGQESLVDVPSGVDYLREVIAAAAAGKPVPEMPAGLPLITHAADVWSRRCVYHELCACDHTRCRAGFADEETTVTNGMRDVYPAVRRCPSCNDALLMAEERGIARKPSRTVSRRL